MTVVTVVVVVVFFTLTDRASTIPSNTRGCQSGTWSAVPTESPGGATDKVITMGADLKNPLLLLFVVSHIQRIGCQPEKNYFTRWPIARGLLNREKRTKEKSGSIPAPTPHTARSEKINKITRRIYRRYAGLGRSRVLTWIPSARRLGLWVWLRKILHSRLR